MDTLKMVLIMAVVAAVLLVAAVITDRRLQRRMERRRMLEAHPELAPQKRDAADTLIEVLNRTGEAVRRIGSTGEDK